MLCEYILKETIDRKGKFYTGAPWLYCDQKLETHSVFFSQVLLPEKPSWLAWLGSDTVWFSLFSHDSIQTSLDESNLKLDVILASLSINVILLCQYLWCRMCLWCLLAVVAANICYALNVPDRQLCFGPVSIYFNSAMLRSTVMLWTC
jgi:hypothetical protein